LPHEEGKTSGHHRLDAIEDRQSSRFEWKRIRDFNMKRAGSVRRGQHAADHFINAYEDKGKRENNPGTILEDMPAAIEVLSRFD